MPLYTVTTAIIKSFFLRSAAFFWKQRVAGLFSHCITIWRPKLISLELQQAVGTGFLLKLMSLFQWETTGPRHGWNKPCIFSLFFKVISPIKSPSALLLALYKPAASGGRGKSHLRSSVSFYRLWLPCLRGRRRQIKIPKSLYGHAAAAVLN